MSNDLVPNSLIAAALSALQAGQLTEAQKLYEKILALKPDHGQALHNLGVIAHQQRRHKTAIDLITKAIQFDSNIAGYYYNLGTAHHALQQYEDAAVHYRKAIDLKQDYAAAHFNLANVFASLNKHDEAVLSYKQTIKLAPNIAEAHYNLAHAFENIGRLEETEAAYRRALAIKPNFLEAINGLCRLTFKKGDAIEALVLSIRSLTLSPTEEAKSIFVDAARYCSRTGQPAHSIVGLQAMLVRAIKEHWVRPNEIIGISVRALELDPAVGKCIEASFKISPRQAVNHDLYGISGPAAVAANELLLLLLRSAPISNGRIEKFVICARQAMLTHAGDSSKIDDKILNFYACLATQFFITEYILAPTDKGELEQAQEARDALLRAFENGTIVSPVQIVVVASYFPLGNLSGAEKLLQQRWPDSVAVLLKQQVGDQIEERKLRTLIPKLTPIADQVSLQVQAQYEENPYPRWVETTAAWDKPSKIDEFLRVSFPLAHIEPPEKNDRYDILVAGCGTGRQAIEIAQQFASSHVLAVDLSLSALAYAKRMTNLLGVKNIEYGQADITELGSIGRSFDIVYASGVLHHLADPWAGWQKLISLLSPRGFMNVGLYSERARTDIVEAQRFVSEKGFKPTADNIRRSRAEIRSLPDDAKAKNVALLADFYSTSDLRDLLFHVQEHRTGLPQIARFLSDNELQFLGFDQAPHILQRYQQNFPNDPAMIDMSLWDRFEQENPYSFIGMYQFWIQKRSESRSQPRVG